jgi:hypothetical protein
MAREDSINKGQPGGYAGLDEFEKVANALSGSVNNSVDGNQQAKVFIQAGIVDFDSSKPFDGNVISADLIYPVEFDTPPVVIACVKEWDDDVPSTHIPTGCFCAYANTWIAVAKLKVPSALPAGVVRVSWLAIGKYTG